MMTRIKWGDKMPRAEVSRMCGLMRIEDRRGRLRLFGHVRRAEGKKLHGQFRKYGGSKKARCRKTKNNRECVLEDLRKTNIKEELVFEPIRMEQCQRSDATD